MNNLSRYQANCLIMAKLQRLVDKWPQFRFQQLLQNCGIAENGCDKYYEESTKTLEKLTKFEANLAEVQHMEG